MLMKLLRKISQKNFPSQLNKNHKIKLKLLARKSKPNRTKEKKQNSIRSRERLS